MSWTAGVTKQVLPNGLTLLVQPDPSSRAVAVVTHLRAGYFDEPDQWVGVSHLLEHLWFKGTARRGPGEIAREIQRWGGSCNATTSYDRTVYYTVLPARAGALEAALDVHADALMHAALDPEAFAKEREVVIQEAKRKLDSPPAVAGETLYHVLFRVHRMRRWRIGTEAGLRRLTVEDLRRYYQSRYTPARTIVALVGDLDPDRALGLAADRFGSWDRAAEPVEPSPAEPLERHPACRVLRGDVLRPLAAVGWRTVGPLHPDAAILDMAAWVLGAGRGSRLWRGVRLAGLATSVAAGHTTPTEVGVFELSLEAEPARLDQAVSRSLALAEALETEPPAEPELERARALFRSSWARRWEHLEARAQVLAGFEALGDYRRADAYYCRVLEVSGTEIQQAARQYLRREVAGAVVYLPPGQATAFETQWPPSPEPPLALAVPRWSLPGGAWQRAAGEAVEYPGEVLHLATGTADLLVRPKRGSGLVSLGLYFPGLRDDEGAQLAGRAALAMRSALRGAGGLDAEGLAYAAEALGGTVAWSVSGDLGGWSLSVPAAMARPAAALLRCVALEPALEEAGFAVERRLQADEAERRRDDLFQYPLQRALALAFADDPYGQPVLGEPDVVRGLELDQVRRWARELARTRPVVVAVGDLGPAELLAVLAPLAAWPAGSRAWQPGPAPAWHFGTGAEKREKEQTAQAWAFPAPPAGSPEAPVLEVMAALLGGLAGRLFQAVREERALAYTASALPWVRRRAGALLVYTATSPEREAEAREAVLAELERLAREPVPEAELERARRYAQGLAALRRQIGSNIAAELVEHWVAGTLAQWADWPARLGAVTAEDLLGLASRMCQGHTAYVVRGSKGAVLVGGGAAA